MDHARWVSREVGLTQGGLCEVDYMRWVTRGGLREVVMRGGSHARWIMRGGLCKVGLM